MLLESQGISACRNKCASISMSGWETKNIWGWCLPPPALARPRRLAPFLPTTAKAAWLLPRGSSWRLYLNTLLMCKLSSSINREEAVNVLYLQGLCPTKPSGSQVINARGSSQPSGNSCQGTQPGMCNLPVWVNRVSAISALMPGYGPPIYYFLHLLLGCVWTKTRSTDHCKDLTS